MKPASLLLGMFFLTVSIGCTRDDTHHSDAVASAPLIAFNSERDGNSENTSCDLMVAGRAGSQMILHTMPGRSGRLAVRVCSSPHGVMETARYS